MIRSRSPGPERTPSACVRKMYCSKVRSPITYSGGSTQMPISSRSSWPSTAVPWRPEPTRTRRIVAWSAMTRNSSDPCGFMPTTVRNIDAACRRFERDRSGLAPARHRTSQSSRASVGVNFEMFAQGCSGVARLGVLGFQPEGGDGRRVERGEVEVALEREVLHRLEAAAVVGGPAAQRGLGVDAAGARRRSPTPPAPARGRASRSGRSCAEARRARRRCGRALRRACPGRARPTPPCGTACGCRGATAARA